MIANLITAALLGVALALSCVFGMAAGMKQERFEIAQLCATQGSFYEHGHRFECEDFNEDD